MFISFEGIDGSGKSTQARRLASALRDAGRRVTLTREPGGSQGAEEIRRLLLTGEPDRWSATTEILLFTAARRDHVERTIRPALARGEVVITDRFADSTRLYQGLSRHGGAPMRALVDDLHARVIGIEPDVTFVIDLDPDVGLARSLRRLAGSEGTEAAAGAAEPVPPARDPTGQATGGPVPEDRFETFGPLFQQRLRAAFLDLAARHPSRVRLIDGSGSADAVAGRVRAALA